MAKHISLRFAYWALSVALLTLPTGCSKEARANRHIARAQKDVAAGKFQNAEIEYIAALRLVGLNPEAVAGLGAAYLEQGKLPQAFGALTQAVKLNPSNADALARLGIACRSLGQVNEARKHAGKALDKDPGNEKALLLLVDCSSSKEDLEDCTRRIDALPAALKGSVTEHLAKGTVKFRENDTDGALAEFKQASAVDPKSEKPYVALATVYLSQKQVSDAESALRTASQLAPLRSPARIHYAQLLVETGKHNEAKKVAAEMTEKVPDYMPAWTFLARLAFDQRKQEECETLVKKILDRDPGNYEGLSLKGKLLMAKGDSPGAIKQFETIVQAYGTNADHFYNLALAQVQNRQENLAIASLDRAIAASSNHVDSILLQAMLLTRQSSYSRATLELKSLIQQAPALSKMDQAKLPQAFSLLARAQQGMNDYSEAANTYQAMRKVFSGLLEVHLEAANGLAGLRRTNEARDAYLQYVDLSTNSPGLVLAGTGLVAINDLSDARKAFEKSFNASPQYMPALESLVQLDMREGNFDGAIKRAQTEIDKGNGGGWPWMLVGRAHMEKAVAAARQALGSGASDDALHKKAATLDDFKAAEAPLQKSIEIDPGLSTSYLLLAQFYVGSGRKEEALNRLNSLVTRSNVPSAFLQIALIQAESGNKQAAVEAYEKTIESAPNSVVALNNLAAIYSADPQRLDRARELAQKASQLRPDVPGISDTLAWVLYKQGEYRQALGLLEAVAKELHDEPEFNFHLGMTYYMLGREQAAKPILEQVATVEKEFPGKGQASRCLAVIQIDPAKADASAVKIIEQQLQEVPSDINALSKLARIQERDGAFDKAAATYESLLNYRPNDQEASLRLLRIYAEQLNDKDKAIAVAKAAQNNNVNSPQIAAILGRLSWLDRNWNYAVSQLEQSARQLPDDPEIASDLAWAYFSIGRLPEAEAQMKIAAAAPGFRKADDANQFLRFLSACQDPASAQKLAAECDSVLAKNPEYVPAVFASGLAKEQQGDYQAAAQVYERVLGMYPLFAPAARNLALLQFDHLNQESKAYEQASKARSSLPSDPALARVLGIIACKRGENVRGAQLLKEAAENVHDDPKLFFYLGMAQKALRLNDDSKRSLEQAVSLNLQEPLLSQANKALADSK